MNENSIFAVKFTNMKKMEKRGFPIKSIIASCAVVVALLIILTIRDVTQKEQVYQRDAGVIWTTDYHITYKSNNNLNDSIQNILKTADKSISPFNKKSLITKINDNTSDVVDEYFMRLYNASVKINKISGGVFDPTVSPLVNAWGFGYKSGELPDSVAIDSLMEFVGINKTSLNGNRLTKNDARISFNFSAIAKGMGSDEVGRMLERNGVENYMVEIGGEIALRGVNDRGSKWRISVDMPIESSDSVIHNSAIVMELSNCGIATSGNYRNYKIVNGHKVAHTINPTTGYPEISNLLSATIVAPDCMTADAYATTCMVLGVERSIALLNTRKELAGMLIYADKNGKMIKWESPRFTKLVLK